MYCSTYVATGQTPRAGRSLAPTNNTVSDRAKFGKPEFEIELFDTRHVTKTYPELKCWMPIADVVGDPLPLRPRSPKSLRFQFAVRSGLF